MSIGGSKKKSSSSSSFDQNVWGPSEQTYKDYFGRLPFDQVDRAGNVLAEHAPELYDQISGYVNSADPAYQNQLGGGQVSGFNQQISPELQQSIGQSLNSPSQTSQVYNEIQGGGNPYLSDKITGINNRLADNLYRYGLPKVNDAAVHAGQAGSSRHGIAEGLTRSDAYNKMADTTAGLLSDDYDSNLDRRLDIANQADSNRLALQQSLLGQQTQGDATQQQALTGVLPSLAGSSAARVSPWAFAGQYPLQQYQGFAPYVQPHILSSGKQQGSARGGSFGVSLPV